MKIYKNSWFNRFANKNDIEDECLITAVKRAEKGLIDADLGGYVIKQRIARRGQGSSGGYRAIIIMQQKDRYFFIFGYAKSEKENISAIELREFKKLAALMISISESNVKELLKNRSLVEVKRE